MKKKTKKENNSLPKVVFREINPVLFRTTSIGYLYEICQDYPTVLLTGKLDTETKKILRNKKLFPKLEEIIFIEEPFFGKVLLKNIRLYRTIKKAVRNHKPDIVMSSEDVYPGSLYLMRLAKKAGAVAFAFQSGFQIAEGEKLYLWSCLANSYLKMPAFLPFPIRMFFVRLKKYLGHFFYYWLLPLTVGEMPFLGKTSFIFWKISAGLMGADYSAVFSKRELDLCLKDGVPREKLVVLGHPLTREKTKKFLKKVYFPPQKNKKNKKILTVMLPDEKIGFTREKYLLITEKETQKNRAKIIRLISEILFGWKIFVKPHPDIKTVSVAKKILGQTPDNVLIADPSDSADRYIEMSSVVIGMSSPSTTLFTASLQCPEKIILFLDLNREFLGDSYKNFNGIKYVDSEKKLIDTLNLIRSNKYYKKPANSPNSDFSDTNELLDYIYTHRQRNK